MERIKYDTFSSFVRFQRLFEQFKVIQNCVNKYPTYLEVEIYYVDYKNTWKIDKLTAENSKVCPKIYFTVLGNDRLYDLEEYPESIPDIYKYLTSGKSFKLKEFKN